GQRRGEGVPAEAAPGEQLVAASRAREHLVVLAEDCEQPVLLPNRLDAGQDRVPLVQQEPAEVGEVGRAVEGRRGTPGTGEPAAVKLNLAGKWKRAVAEDTIAVGESAAAGNDGPPLLESLKRDDLHGHPLPAYLRRQRLTLGTVDAGLDQPDGPH